jgi:serine/threonine protein kinase
MGEVYRAWDSRLNRDVAIKILREPGASADLRSRFEREARAVAALNHPNIVAVFDVGLEGSQQYIASELIEGEWLRTFHRGRHVPSASSSKLQRRSPTASPPPTLPRLSTATSSPKTS